MVYNHFRISSGMHPVLAAIGFPISYLASQLRYLGSSWGMYAFPSLVTAQSLMFFSDSSRVVSCLIVTRDRKWHVFGSVLLEQTITRSKAIIQYDDRSIHCISCKGVVYRLTGLHGSTGDHGVSFYHTQL